MTSFKYVYFLIKSTSTRFTLYTLCIMLLEKALKQPRPCPYCVQPGVSGDILHHCVPAWCHWCDSQVCWGRNLLPDLQCGQVCPGVSVRLRCTQSFTSPGQVWVSVKVIYSKLKKTQVSFKLNSKLYFIFFRSNDKMNK